jgi:hypothetical protein
MPTSPLDAKFAPANVPVVMDELLFLIAKARMLIATTPA